MRAANADPSPVVAELQGLYGAFSFSEILLQKIWLRGDFDRAAAVATDGTRIRIDHPGIWNRLGGPDFLGARLRLGEGSGRSGDVEVHLRAGDWDAHGHADDPAYAKVILHVVLFPPEAGRVTRGAGGQEIPVLALLPLLHRAIEEYAVDEAVEVLAGRPQARLIEELGGLPLEEREAVLRECAARRWRQKTHFAKLRLTRLGWTEACHHAALEILGYRFNRAPMLRLAGRWALAEWARGKIDPEEAYASEAGEWSLQGVRPANHPRLRLRQYAAWSRERPDWPERLAALAGELPEIGVAEEGGGARTVRRNGCFTELRKRLGEELCAGCVGGTRFDNLIGDGVLPLLAAHAERDCEGLWLHWFPGDVPVALASGLRELGVCDGRARPISLGAVQGLLGWLIEYERR